MPSCTGSRATGVVHRGSTAGCARCDDLIKCALQVLLEHQRVEHPLLRRVSPLALCPPPQRSRPVVLELVERCAQPLLSALRGRLPSVA